jgi:hypothetical protein
MVLQPLAAPALIGRLDGAERDPIEWDDPTEAFRRSS